MPAVFFIALFSLVIALMMSFVVGSGSNVGQLNQQLAQETENYFKNLELVVNQDITPKQLELANDTATAEQILRQNALAQMAPGRWGNPLYDAWGNPLSMPVNFPRENVAISADARVPVTGIILISAGPDRIFQTNLPTGGGLSGLFGVVPPSGSDDIVTTFTDEEAQRQTLASLNSRLERIAKAMLRVYKIEFAKYRLAVEANYRNELLSNPSAPPPDWSSLIANDENAPQFVDIRDTEARKTLGVEEEFAFLERLLPNNGQMRVTFQESAPDLHLGATLLLTNASNASPWPVVQLKIPLKGGF